MNKKTAVILVAVVAIVVGVALYLKRGSSGKNELKPFHFRAAVEAIQPLRKKGRRSPASSGVSQ